jgi:hypothetical protein
VRPGEAFADLGVPLGLPRVVVGELVHHDGRFVHETGQVLSFLLGQRPLLVPRVVAVAAEHLVDGPKAQLRRLRHEDVLVAVQQRSDLKLRKEPCPAVVDDDVGHALQKFQHRLVLQFAEVHPGALIGGVAADHRHPLQPRDGIAQVSVNFDLTLPAGLIEAPER